MLFTKQNYVESSHFKVANSFQASPGSCLISMSHSSLSSLCNELEHTRRIRGWAYLKKVHFLPNELADKENSTCMHERIMRDILLIFNEFIVAPLWFMCSYFQYPQFKIFEIEIRRYFPLQINRHLIRKRVSLTCIYSIRLCYANSIPCIDKRNIFFYTVYEFAYASRYKL